MKGKLALLGGLAVGYVLATRDGRERFEQIKGKATSMWNDPTVQQKMSDAQDFAKEKAPEVQDKVTQVATDTVGKVKNRGQGGEHAASSTGDTGSGSRSSTGSSPSTGSSTGSTPSTGSGATRSTSGSTAGTGSSSGSGSSSTAGSTTGSGSGSGAAG